MFCQDLLFPSQRVPMICGDRRLEFRPFLVEMVDYYCLIRFGPSGINGSLSF